jgi:DNA gyrase subunit A
VSDVSVIGRNTQGVRVIRLSEDDLFVAVAVVMPREQEDDIVDEAEDGPATDQATFETEGAETPAENPDD